MKAHGIGLATTEQRDTVNWPLPERVLYPIDYQYKEAFMNVDQELILQHPVIKSENTMGSVAIEFAQDCIQDALVCVLFRLGAGIDGSLIAHFEKIQLLTMLAL